MMTKNSQCSYAGATIERVCTSTLLAVDGDGFILPLVIFVVTNFLNAAVLERAKRIPTFTMKLAEQNGS